MQTPADACPIPLNPLSKKQRAALSEIDWALAQLSQRLLFEKQLCFDAHIDDTLTELKLTIAGSRHTLRLALERDVLPVGV